MEGEGEGERGERKTTFRHWAFSNLNCQALVFRAGYAFVATCKLERLQKAHHFWKTFEKINSWHAFFFRSKSFSLSDSLNRWMLEQGFWTFLRNFSGQLLFGPAGALLHGFVRFVRVNTSRKCTMVSGESSWTFTYQNRNLPCFWSFFSLALIGIIPDPILFPFYDKDRRTASQIRRKNTAQLPRESNQGLANAGRTLSPLSYESSPFTKLFFFLVAEQCMYNFGYRVEFSDVQ